MATTAQYTAQPILEYSQVTTAQTTLDNPASNAVKISTGPSATAAAGVGQRVNRITIQATGNTTAGFVRIYLSLDSGTTKRLIAEKAVTVATVSATVAAFRAEVPEVVGLILPGGGVAELYATTHNTETFNIIVESGRL